MSFSELMCSVSASTRVSTYSFCSSIKFMISSVLRQEMVLATLQLGHLSVDLA